MIRGQSGRLTWLTAFAFALALNAQQKPPQAPDPVIRVTVDLVQVDAVVTDAEGRHVAGLRSEDFEVLEDGEPQKITHLSYVTEPRGSGRSAFRAFR